MIIQLLAITPSPTTYQIIACTEYHNTIQSPAVRTAEMLQSHILAKQEHQVRAGPGRCGGTRPQRCRSFIRLLVARSTHRSDGIL